MHSDDVIHDARTDATATPPAGFDPERHPILAVHFFGLDVFDICPGALGADRQRTFAFSERAAALLGDLAGVSP